MLQVARHRCQTRLAAFLQRRVRSLMRRRGSSLGLAFPALMLAMQGVQAASVEDSGAINVDRWIQRRGVTVQLDNDLFAVSNRDRDYTGGLSVSGAQFDPPPLWNPERWLGSLLAPEPRHRSLHALQFQVIAFSPGMLEVHDPQPNDRPYASLWALTGARQRVSRDGMRADFASLTAGALGLHATEVVHRAIHRATGAEVPQGYRHQISRGGEPTAKLTVAQRRLLAGGGIGAGSDIWLSVSGSAGYLTEGSLAIAGRFGERALPWWASAPELAQYSPAPDLAVVPLGTERTIDAGVRITAKVWNAFLQGQFRTSDVTVDPSRVQRVVAAAWVGVSITTPSGSRFAYRITAQSPEVRDGPAARTHLWGSLSWTRNF